MICNKLHNHPDFANREINLVGISQGGLLARAVVERCPDLEVHTLFTFGAPHNGVSPQSYVPLFVKPFATYLAKLLIQLELPVTYFEYFRSYQINYKSDFLADLNNEGDYINLEYKKRLSSVKNFGLFMWQDDILV